MSLEYSPTNDQIAALYNEALVAWEREFSAIEENWQVETLKASLDDIKLEIASVEAAAIEKTLNDFILGGTTDFFVITRGASRGRDVFRHFRNAIAHAGVTRHRSTETDGTWILRFRSPNANKKAVAMAGQLREHHLQPFIAALCAMAAQAKELSSHHNLRQTEIDNMTSSTKRRPSSGSRSRARSIARSDR